MNYDIMRARVGDFAEKIRDDRLKKMFLSCFYSTLDTTTEILEDGTSYVFTGDIPAMWLRDSSVQVTGYLPYAEYDPEVKTLIKGLIARQMKYVLLDPYSNAFKKTPDKGGHRDNTDFHSDYIWERKFEVDSLCYPLWLAKKYYKVTGDASVFTEEFIRAYDLIVRTFKTEQRHDEQSKYFFIREGAYAHDTLDNGGKGAKSNPCGLIWSAFRPSDDRCTYHYLIPANLMAVEIFRGYAGLFSALNDNARSEQAASFAREVDEAVHKYGVYDHPKYGRIYAFETDGYGNYNLMDDANVPSLLSLPYLGYCDKSDPLYQNTRRFILSKDNPYFFEGRLAAGVGSPHTPNNYIWHIAIVMQMLTAMTKEEADECFHRLTTTDGGRGVMHESFDKDDPSRFTREWFAWANTLFALAANKQFRGEAV